MAMNNEVGDIVKVIFYPSYSTQLFKINSLYRVSMVNKETDNLLLSNLKGEPIGWASPSWVTKEIKNPLDKREILEF